VKPCGIKLLGMVEFSEVIAFLKEVEDEGFDGARYLDIGGKIFSREIS